MHNTFYNKTTLYGLSLLYFAMLKLDELNKEMCFYRIQLFNMIKQNGAHFIKDLDLLLSDTS